MIVEPRPLVPGRAEPAGAEPARQPPNPGDDAFGRTLTDVLRNGRTDRPASRGDRRPAPHDEREPAPTTRRDARPEANDDRSDQRVGDDERLAANRGANEKERPDSGSDGDQPTGDTDRPTDRPSDADRHEGSDPDGDVADERHSGQPGASEVAVETAVTGLAPSLEDLTAGTDGDEAATERVDGIGSTGPGATEPGPVVFSEPPVGDTTSAGDGDEMATADSVTGDEAADQTDSPTASTTASRPPAGFGDRIGAADTESDAGAPAPDADDGRDRAGPTGRSPSGDGPVVGSMVSGDEAEAAGDDASVAPAEPTATAESIAAAQEGAVGGSVRAGSPDSPSSEPAADGSVPTEMAAAAATAPPGRPVPVAVDEVGTEAEREGGNLPLPDAPDTVGPPASKPGAGDSETVEPPSASAVDRAPSGLSPVGPDRAVASTPVRPTATAVESSNPVPELVELQTTGLAERLRPAFAAVRRGVNGLEELRLRIQDDNAGPIKVDIATVDNRVRVLLSAGNDDLMRQLGQERDRLADELRRAGFDQASIDIQSEGRGRRDGRYEQEASGRHGSGAARRRHSATAVAAAIERASARPDRGLTGLDLDL